MSGNNDRIGMRTGRALCFGLAIGALALATGCQSIQEADQFLERNWVVQSNMYESDRLAIAVKRAETTMTVAFGPRESVLSADQRDLVRRFAGNSGARRGDTAVVALPPEPSRAVAERRAQSVARELRRYGLRVARSFVPGAPGVATISIERLVAVAPNCPEWNELMKRGDIDEYRQKYGCLNASSLAATVHRPNDLVYGRPVGRSDGPTVERGVQLLREGKFDPALGTQGTGSPQSGTR